MKQKQSDMLKIKIANNLEIKQSKARWNHLVESMQFPSVFLTWEWITTWLKHFGNNYTPIVLFVHNETDILAVIPLAMRTMKLNNGFRQVRTISFCGSMELYPDHLDIICANENKNIYIYIEKIMEFLTYEYTEWDVLLFLSLASEGYLASWLQVVNKKNRIRIVDKLVSPYILTEDSFNVFLRGFQRKKRYNLIREKKILLDTKRVNFKCVKTKEELEKGLKDLFQLHEARANQKGIKSTFDGDSTACFHSDISRAFLELGWLHLCFLTNDGETISAAYGFVFEKRFYYYQTGLHPEWQQFSAGKVLLFKILEDVFNDDIQEFDFLRGDESYKTFWTNNKRLTLSFYLYNNNITGILENWANSSRNVLKSLLKKTPVFNVLKRWVKKQR